MFVILLIIMAADNQEFFDQAHKNHQQGMTWQYVGPQDPTDQPYIPTVREDGTEIILFKMK